MRETLQLTKTMPQVFMPFLESVRRLQPATVQQVCSDLSTVVKPPNIGAVRSAIAFTKNYGFLRESHGRLELEPLGVRLLKCSGNTRIDFLVTNAKLPEQEPFSYLRHELKEQGSLSLQRFRKLIQVKYHVPSAADQSTYATTYAAWLGFLRVASVDGKGLTYTGGRIEGLEILAIDEAEDLLDRTVYDFLTESFPTYHNLLDDPNRLLQVARTEPDEGKKGDTFEKFVAVAFSRLGFSTRTRDGSREQRLNLTFQRKGGGDVALFNHFPTVSEGETKPGCAIACEAKATDGAIGSKAVGQARNLQAKIEEAFPKYVLHAAVISGKNALYDSSGRETATPEVIHITDEMILDVLGMQAKRANRGDKLINPITIMTAIDELVTSGKLEPTQQEFVQAVQDKLGN
jgi:hypothetical protein